MTRLLPSQEGVWGLPGATAQDCQGRRWTWCPRGDAQGVASGWLLAGKPKWQRACGDRGGKLLLPGGASGGEEATTAGWERWGRGWREGGMLGGDGGCGRERRGGLAAGLRGCPGAAGSGGGRGGGGAGPLRGALAPSAAPLRAPQAPGGGPGFGGGGGQSRSPELALNVGKAGGKREMDGPEGPARGPPLVSGWEQGRAGGAASLLLWLRFGKGGGLLGLWGACLGHPWLGPRGPG